MRWHQSDPIPEACDPCQNAREEREYDYALGKPNLVYGLGTVEDPMVIWLNGLPTLNRNMIWAHNNFAKAAAKILGFTHTWIAKGAHDEEYARTWAGRKIWCPETNSWLTRDADMHITMRLGIGLYDCRLSAHAYVVLSDAGCPEKYMGGDFARKLMKKDSDSQIEFWPWRHSHIRELPRGEIRLGRNWELHANVGPYLDTYRPDERRSGDTYTPRETAEHEWNGEDRRVVGRMTPELAALRDKCDAAYGVYKALHFELAAMERPCQKKMRDLHAMREQIVTMKREAYREAGAVIGP
ncbi:hypothetical protein GGR57DRAFT_507567 [Xylariaceae sp. FL1272]|nr:hypothetical protein GGR57DRAFT_507567 [Xylariaceae sp. FL1272]